MLSTANKLMLGLLTLTWLTAATPGARAEGERFGVTAVKNGTRNVTITFMAKNGDGKWEEITLKPGHYVVFSWRYPDPAKKVSPPMRLRFNGAIGKADPFLHECRLSRLAAKEKDYRMGKQYVFVRYSANYFFLKCIN
jgi:hypothetical protein